MISKKARSISSASHINRSLSVGRESSERYLESCEKAGLSIIKSSQTQDIAHIDFFVDGHKVDVKGLKKSHRDGQILVEIKNVQGKKGWCNNSGTPEWIAFDFGAFFLHVDNLELYSFCLKKCDFKDCVSKIGDSLYKGYTRKGRKDLMTLIQLGDVLANCKHWFLPSV